MYDIAVIMSIMVIFTWHITKSESLFGMGPELVYIRLSLSLIFHEHMDIKSKQTKEPQDKNMFIQFIYGSEGFRETCALFLVYYAIYASQPARWVMCSSVEQDRPIIDESTNKVYHNLLLETSAHTVEGILEFWQSQIDWMQTSLCEYLTWENKWVLPDMKRMRNVDLSPLDGNHSTLLC